MAIFAQLSADGKELHYKFEAEERPKFHPSIILIEVTDLDPQPEEGWLYDGENFMPAPMPTINPEIGAVKKISELQPLIVEALADAVLNGKTTELQDLITQLEEEKAKLEDK